MATILEMDPIPDWRLKARSDSTSISPYYSKESVPIRFPGLKKHPITLTERRVTFHAHGTALPFLAALGPDRTECGCVRLYQALTAPAPLRKAGLPTLLKLLAEQTLLATLDHFFLSHGIQVGVRIGPRQIRVGFVAPGTSGLGWPDLAIYDTQGKRWSTWFMLLCDPRYADVLCQRNGTYHLCTPPGKGPRPRCTVTHLNTPRGEHVTRAAAVMDALENLPFPQFRLISPL